MNSKGRINAVLVAVDLNANQFAKAVGLPGPQNIYDIQSEKSKTISGEIASKIVAKYPQFNLEWILTGKGPMLNKPTGQELLQAARGGGSIQSPTAQWT